MNSVIPTNPLFAPHLHENPRHSPPRSDFYTTAPAMSGRKRKASDEPEDRMSTSPSSSPSVHSRTLPAPLQPRPKRHRTASTPGRLLELPRLLETLSKADLQTLVSEICSSNPRIAHEVVSRAPRPTLDSVLTLLRTYESKFKEAFPFGNRPESDYTYNRVRAPLTALLSAISDFTPQFLPPVESQFSASLGYLDAATETLHRIPQFDTFGHNAGRYEGYEEAASAWVVVIREAMKRGGGIQLQLGNWDSKVQRHNQLSGGRLAAAVQELQKGLGWMGRDAGGPGSGSGAAGAMGPAGMGTGGGDGGPADERAQIRQQLFAGTYGSSVGVGGGRW